MAKKKSPARTTRKKTAKKVARKRAAKTTRRKAARKTARKKATRKKVARKKTTTRKKTARKPTTGKPTARKATRKTTARKAAKKTKTAARGKKPAAGVPVKKIAQPKRPRRTTQAAPPKSPPIRRPAEETTGAAVSVQTAGPQVGDWAPTFALRDQDGREHTLWQYRGRKIVLYFYPKDDTPGCTAEACGFRNRMADFTDRNAVVLGISPDSAESHQRFAQKFGLSFPLLADENHEVAERYGVWVEKHLAGREYMGVARTTFVIDQDGRITEIFRKVKPEGHEQEVLERIAPPPVLESPGETPLDG